MNVLRAFWRSPLSRHPSLLARKIAHRLNLYQEDVAEPMAPVSAVAYPSHWAHSLKAWLKQIPLNSGPHPFNQIFGMDLYEALLLQFFREGPRPGDHSITGDIKLVWDYT